MNLKERLEDYTEDEFISYLKEVFYNPKGLKGEEFEVLVDRFIGHFDKIIQHPEGNGLFFYPPKGREDSPEGILREIKRWRKSQGLPLFKDSK